MPESDVTKMKVADLKRELKLRGLPVNGNKNELQDRLQTALIEGDISLEDSAITDAIDDGDVSLTDEDEHKLLGDEHDDDLLLKSPVSTPTAKIVPDLLQNTDTASNRDAESVRAESSSSATALTLPAKKSVRKRNNSQLLTDQHATSATPSTAKENAVPSGAKTETTSKHKPIVVASSTDKSSGDKNAAQLSNQERLEMRAKKFGITPTATSVAVSAVVSSKTAVKSVKASSSYSITANKGNKDTDEQQKEALKRRAERFGCVVPEKNPKTLVSEKLQKRKERFGGAAAAEATKVADPKKAAETETKSSNGGTSSSEWAEKAKARLERFKNKTAVAE